MHRIAVALMCLVVTVGGCGGKQKAQVQTPPPRTEVEPPPASEPPADAPQPPIGKLNVQTLPTVVNLDDRPGADGVQAKLFLFHEDNRAYPAAVALEKGVVEFLLYDGRVSPRDLDAAKPLRVWTHSADQLQRFKSKTAFGVAYGLSLSWGNQRPREASITLSARLLRPGSKPLYAMPLYMAVGPK